MFLESASTIAAFAHRRSAAGDCLGCEDCSGLCLEIVDMVLLPEVIVGAGAADT